jgi:purine-binding chemotaxis protein CheW
MKTQAEAHANMNEVRQLINFAIADEEYGFELQHVKEVIRMREVTWLPEAPSCVRGIVNLRGQVIPIIELREKFGLQHLEATADTRVIVVEEEGSAVGMMVDSASQVVRMPENQIEAPPAVLSKVSQNYITAVGKQGDRLITLLDVKLLLKAVELQALQQVLKDRQAESAMEAGQSAFASAKGDRFGGEKATP